MKLLIFFLALNIALGSSQTTLDDSVLERIENSISILNLRLARIEARQTRNMLIYSGLEDNIKDVKKDLDSKHGETMLWLTNAVTLLNELKMKGERLEAAQSVITDNIQQLINKTDNCCQNDTIIMTCPSQATTSSTKPDTSSSTTTTTLPTTPTPTSTTPATTVPLMKDCKGVDQGGNVKDGVYKLELAGKRSIQVYCSAGYVTIQRRFNGALNFDRSFAEYEQGFGDTSGESWLGLTHIHELTNPGNCSFRVILDIDSTTRYNRNRCASSYASDCDGQTKEILADNFQVSSASDLYRVQIAWKSSDFTNPDEKRYGIDRMNGRQFGAKDKGPEKTRCAGQFAVPGGFWYNANCYPGFPNTVYTTSSTNYCLSSNKVCGYWQPYWFKTSWIQFSC